jgi:hypothetical protein
LIYQVLEKQVGTDGVSDLSLNDELVMSGEWKRHTIDMLQYHYFQRSKHSKKALLSVLQEDHSLYIDQGHGELQNHPTNHQGLVQQLQ